MFKVNVYLTYNRHLHNILFVFLFIIISCNNEYKPSRIENITLGDTPLKSDLAGFYTISDTVYLHTEIGEILIYPKAEYNRLIDHHPEFFSEFPYSPDLAWFSCNNKKEFNSEFGIDTYYALYAHFLKQRNGEEAFAQQRKKLIEIYTTINTLFANFKRGGSFFAHQKMRILGYAEYSIYLLKKSSPENTYDIRKQKDLYLQSLRQQVADEVSAFSDTAGAVKAERIRELNQLVDVLDGLITDSFYLRRAQEFHYTHYEYWP
jgi:hypothetical protein